MNAPGFIEMLIKLLYAEDAFFYRIFKVGDAL